MRKKTIFYYNEEQKKAIEQDYGDISVDGRINEDILAVSTEQMFFHPYISIEDEEFLTVDQLKREMMEHLYPKCLICDEESCEDCSPFYEEDVLH